MKDHNTLGFPGINHGFIYIPQKKIFFDKKMGSENPTPHRKLLSL